MTNKRSITLLTDSDLYVTLKKQSLYSTNDDVHEKQSSLYFPRD